MIKVENSFFVNGIPTKEICTLQQAKANYTLDEEYAHPDLIPENTLGVVIEVDEDPEAWDPTLITIWIPLSLNGAILTEVSDD